MRHKPVVIALLVAVSAAVVAVPAGGVVGGTPAKLSTYSWYVELPFCGGALVSPDRVLTAAHCVAGFPVRDIGTVRVGGTVSRKVAGISVEPNYVRRALDGTANRDAPRDDIAIVLLDRPVTNKPIGGRLAQPKAGTRVLLLGRGQKTVPKKVVKSVANFEKRLRKATLVVLSDGKCRAYYRKHGGKTYRSALRDRTMLCATDPDGRKPFRSASHEGTDIKRLHERLSLGSCARCSYGS